MKKLILSIIFIITLSSQVFALSITGNVGTYIPTGAYKNKFKVGYDYGITASQKFAPFSYFQFNWHRYNANAKDGGEMFGAKDYEVNGDAFELLYKFSPINIIVNPYIAAGGGYYTHNISSKSFSTQKHNGFGFVAEAGVNFNFLILSAGINARYILPFLSGGGYNEKAESWTVGAQLSVNIPFTN